MILDHLDAADVYAPCNAAFAEAIAFLRRADLADLPDGRIALDGDRLFAIVAHDAGRGLDAARLEAHRRYIDIQFCLAGLERIGWKPTADCAAAGAFDESADVGFFTDSPSSWVDLQPGMLAVFYPSDAHAPLAGTGVVHKVVVKVVAL
jgi:YhcH/YjgK/YiaL family protein